MAESIANRNEKLEIFKEQMKSCSLKTAVAILVFIIKSSIDVSVPENSLLAFFFSSCNSNLIIISKSY